MSDSVMILGGDLFSLLVARILDRLGTRVIWVSCRQSQQTSYGRELDQALLNASEAKKYLEYLKPSSDGDILSSAIPEHITVLEDASLLNFLDNGSIVDIRLKVGSNIQKYKCSHMIACNRYFGLHKKLRLAYESTDLGNRLGELTISRCHLMGEVTYLYFKPDQIAMWFEQLDSFIRTMKVPKGIIRDRQQLVQHLMSPQF